jgi:hypothetical protein
MTSTLRYRHRQFGAVVVGSLAGSAWLVVALGLTLGERVLLFGGPVLMSVAALLFYNLTVEIDATHLTFRFGIGLVHRRIALADIVAVQTVRNSVWHGWGIHRTPHGWLYNVSGWEAVEIQPRN